MVESMLTIMTIAGFIEMSMKHEHTMPELRKQSIRIDILCLFYIKLLLLLPL